ncbi:AMP-dependent synthetase and ligase [Natronococcus amylolyticus DSM 10524]|uniref:acetate--CoA ligase n=1 Tax=Natronococcus amylolyticus DSM 10524 TaxID=1227497 RepID=L9XEU1_9EURY|nr:AMP-binding protein [Natronococcus amylolyticus]ELY60245.1 AMP-dependent synthetase and ligase [Natronococcus amylolyticus DSM 10524]
MGGNTSLEDVDEIVHEPSEEFVESTNVAAFMREYGIDDYEALIERTTTELEGEPESGVDWFWDELVDYLGIEFYEEYDEVRDDGEAQSTSDDASGETASRGGPQFTDWYPGGELNLAHNVADRHAARDEERRNKVATIWEGEDGEVREITYHELRRQSNQVANALEERGIETGDTVGLYMPMVPEVASILYGCFKVGAIAVPIFSGFGVDATATRIADSECSVLFTGDGFYRRGSPVRLKGSADEAIEEAGYVEDVIVFDRLGSSDDGDVPWTDDRDEWWADAVESQSDEYETKSLPSNQESMLLYSSGTTGKPKGIVHTHAGVQVQCPKEVHFGMDLKPSDRFFWVSDIGWMMGPWTLIGTHTFGGTVFMYEGAPDHPEPDRFWEMIDRHELTQFGISPTAIRALRKHGDEWLSGHDLSSLRLLGSTGEPWDPESWRWFYENVGNGEAPIINISGGTEICGCFLMPMPSEPLKPCTLGGPGLGMDIDIVDATGESIREDNERGYLVARDSCPSMTKSLWSGDERYLEEYWSRFDDMWNHGDWAQKDADGFWFLHGRADDALNVAGRKVGPAEVEGALIDHDAVNQAAAIGAPDDTTGTAVVTYVILEDGREESDDLREELRAQVGEELGKPFRPREVLFVDEFPKTQSGKIIRRAIEATYTGEDLGDMSSIENPDALEDLEDAR